jgi:polysaccharide biosynthesis/export protein
MILISGCSKWVTPFRMYKTDKKTELSSIDDIKTIKEHIINKGDQLIVYVFANKADVFINPEFAQTQSGNQPHISYRVLEDGSVFLPGLGFIHLAGKTITQAESFLSAEYEKFVIDPFVKVEITNKKCFVHKGGKNGSAVAVELSNPNATVIEALSQSGGIADGKAHKILLIRGENENLKMYEIDLSVAENAALGNIVLQSNDIIYVTPQTSLSRRLVEDITPILSLTTTILLIYNLFK